MLARDNCRFAVTGSFPSNIWCLVARPTFDHTTQDRTRVNAVYSEFTIDEILNASFRVLGVLKSIPGFFPTFIYRELVITTFFCCSGKGAIVLLADKRLPVHCYSGVRLLAPQRDRRLGVGPFSTTNTHSTRRAKTFRGHIGTFRLGRVCRNGSCV
jgi:hypothetical protein